MIFSHISYCPTTWSHPSEAILKPFLFKKTLKILGKKPLQYHYCVIISKYNILDFDSIQIFMDTCLIFKVSNGIAHSPLMDFISEKTTNRINSGVINK